MTKPVYERPLLVRHQAGMANKLSRLLAQQPLTHLEGVAVAGLVERYGSPLFVFSEARLVEAYRSLHDAFSTRYPHVEIAWSYKTNYLDAVCRTFHGEGALAEVVSEFEYDKALRMGVSPDRIHFNGPCKSEAVLERALPAGTSIHIDHFDELALAERVATRLDIEPAVAIRLNFAVPGTPSWSRFGFNLETGQARDAVVRLLAGGRLRLAGLHCHIGTFIQDVEAYREAARKLAGFANEIRARHGVRLDFIDVGGGFASHNTLREQYLPGDQATPSFARYAEAIVDGLADLDMPPRELPRLILETGRALVDDAGHLVTTVLANKRLPDGRRALVLDAGINTLFTANWYKHDVVPAQPFHGIPEPTVMYGPLCMNIDVLRDTLLCPPLEVGDRVVFCNVGAYNVTQWMQFITYRPNVVMIGPDGRDAVIRRRESLADIVALEETPSWQATP
jgi:diaminopimelate decarboxylase